MKTYILILACCAVLCLCIYPLCHRCSEPTIPSLMDIQRLINVEPDGIYGPKTDLAWRQAYANQEAAKFFTPSGGKEN